MQQLNNLSKVGLFLIAIIFFTSCGDTKTNDDKNTALVEKENELLKKENELLKKEKELNSTTTTKPINEPAKSSELQTSPSVENLDNLRKMNGKYPYDAKLLQNPVLTKRLKNLLKGRYKFLKETWAVETPIEINNDIFVASGCQQHNCGNTNFIIVVDFSKDVLYAGIREDQVVKVYSEDGSSNSEIIKWANDN